MFKYAYILVNMFLFYQVGKFPFVVQEMNEQGESYLVISWTSVPKSDLGGSRETHMTKRPSGSSKITVIGMISN